MSDTIVDVIVAGNGGARVSLATMTVIVGSIQSRKLGPVLAWAKANRHLIVAEWNALNPTKPAKQVGARP